MKKIMFNDRYGLTKAVLEGRKTMTRRIVKHPEEVEVNGHKYLRTEKLRYKVGEVVAVAQSYNDSGWNPNTLQQTFVKEPTVFPDLDPITPLFGWIDLPLKYHKGWSNKMFVYAGLMPHQIRITNVRVERLQDISDEDCLREGIYNWKDAPDCPSGHKDSKIECYGYDGSWDGHLTLITAFAALIDKVSGKGTWANNPWVFVYEFELVK